MSKYYYLIIPIIVLVFMVKMLLFSSTPIYFATYDNIFIRTVALNILTHDKFHEGDDYFGLDRVNFLLYEYQKNKNKNKNKISIEYLQAACSLIDNKSIEKSNRIQSVSFLNAVLDNDVPTVLIWIFRNININDLKITNELFEETSTFETVMSIIIKRKNNIDFYKNESYKIAVQYKIGKLNLKEYSDPCYTF